MVFRFSSRFHATRDSRRDHLRPNGTVFPVLQLSGPSDTDNRGRWIPTASVEQYAATLASWYGVAKADLPIVFPNIGRFATSDLGFMA